MLIYSISLKPALSLWSNICSDLQTLEKMLSRFDHSSETWMLNQGKTKVLSDALKTVLDICAAYWLRTAGLFDVSRKDFRRLHWRVGAIELSGMDLDFGGIGKGLALKQIQDRLDSFGVTCAFIDFGGSSILGVGSHPFGPCWKVSVQNPWTGESVREVELKDMCLSTSGNRPGYSGHIVNPLDGSPCEGRRMVTVKASDPLDAEVLSTAVMIADHEQEDIIRQNFPSAEINRYDL